MICTLYSTSYLFDKISLFVSKYFLDDLIKILFFALNIFLMMI
jgi:hypothetical protein